MIKKLKNSIVILPVILNMCCTLSGVTNGLHAQGNPMNEPVRRNFSRYVDPFIGTGGHGHVFLGANVPFGMVQAGPVNINKGWDWCSGYHYSSREILGFTHTHLSGTGIGDWGDILLLPATGDVRVKAATKDDLSNGYGSPFSHENEECRPGYYRVKLDRYGTEAAMTTKVRTAIHRYNFGRLPNPHILIDLAYGTGWDKVTSSALHIRNDSTVAGFRKSTGWAKDQRVYFAIRTSRKIAEYSLYDEENVKPGNNLESTRVRGVLKFDGLAGNEVLVKIALSNVSMEKAVDNLEAEIPGWQFDEVADQALLAWDEALSVIDYKASDSLKNIFYTALYHTMFFPSVYEDNDGEYLGSDMAIHKSNGFTNTTVYSLWDTYRAFHPLMTLIRPDLVNDFVSSMLAIYQQQGKLPVWHLSGNETNTMVGYHAVPVIVDAYLKGFRDYDVELAYEAVRHSAMQQTDGIQYIQRMAHIPADSVNESVAKALEYAIDDDCISMMAEALGKKDDAVYFKKRAGQFASYFDANTGFMRGKMADGKWRGAFDPLEAKHRQNDYCEGNAWQYIWLVPHDVPGLVKLFGSENRFERKLDSLFTVTGHMGDHASPDISGLIGQYAHGNEPNHHVAYLYNYIGKPWKTADVVRQVMDTFYTAQVNGLCGNEDAGQMSAWYILSALGFYQVHPANGIFVMGTPMMSEAVISLPNGAQLSIKTERTHPDDKYIQRVTRNGLPFNTSYITYADMMVGGELKYYMGRKPGKEFGISSAARP